MEKFNPNAIIFWIFTTLFSWLFFGQNLEAAVGGLCVGLGISLIAALFS